MSLLVTGAAGFIGSHFVELLLEEGETDIVCLDNFNDDYDPRIKRDNLAAFADDPRVRLVEGNFCDPETLERLFDEWDIRRVAHLGARAGVRRSVEIPLEYERSNVRGTLALLEAARKRDVERFLLVSSSTVYGEGAESPFVEDAPLGVPLSPYGASKRSAEVLGQTYHRLHGLPVVCLRPFSVIGPRLRPDLALSIFTQAILEGRPITLFGDGSVRRDFTHVDDICRGLYEALRRPGLAGEAINLGCGRPVQMRRVIRCLEEELQTPANVRRLAPRPEDMSETFADISKAQRLLGYRPMRVFEEGVQEFVAWYRRSAPATAVA